VKEEKAHSCHLDRSVPFDHQVLFSDIQKLDRLRKRTVIAKTAITGQERVLNNVFDLHASLSQGECGCDVAETSRYIRLDLVQRQEALTSFVKKLDSISRTVSLSSKLGFTAYE
jgi:hypothetical protein